MLVRRLRKLSAPAFASFLRLCVRSVAIPIGLRRWAWNCSSRYVSFYDVPATVQTVAGFKIAVTTAPMVERQIYHFGQWEPQLTKLLMNMSYNDRVFLDLGANIGYLSLLAASRFRQVIAIEASPSTFRRLNANVEQNGFSNIICYNVAVGENVGIAPFYFDPSHSGASSMTPGPGKILEANVLVSPLFQIISPEVMENIGFVKIDVEGFEHIVMRQLLEKIDLVADDVMIMVEYGPDREGDLRQVLDEFRDVGFVVHLLQGPYSLEEYLTDRRLDLPVLTNYPDVFCDLLLMRQTAVH